MSNSFTFHLATSLSYVSRHSWCLNFSDGVKVWMKRRQMRNWIDLMSSILHVYSSISILKRQNNPSRNNMECARCPIVPLNWSQANNARQVTRKFHTVSYMLENHPKKKKVSTMAFLIPIAFLLIAGGISLVRNSINLND